MYNPSEAIFMISFKVLFKNYLTWNALSLKTRRSSYHLHNSIHQYSFLLYYNVLFIIEACHKPRNLYFT